MMIGILSLQSLSFWGPRLLAKAPWIVPIQGTTKLSRLGENLGGPAIELIFDDLHSLEEASSAIKMKANVIPRLTQSLSTAKVIDL